MVRRRVNLSYDFAPFLKERNYTPPHYGGVLIACRGDAPNTPSRIFVRQKHMIKIVMSQ